MAYYGNRLWVAQGVGQDHGLKIQYSETTDMSASPASWKWRKVAGNIFQGYANYLFPYGKWLLGANGNTLGTVELPPGTGSTDIKVGDDSLNITSIHSHNGVLFCGKPDGVYQITITEETRYGLSGYSTRIINWDGRINSNNGKYVASWNDAIYFSMANGDIVRWNGAVAESVSPMFMTDPPGLLFPNRARNGNITALLATPNFLYCAINGTPSSELEDDRLSSIYRFNGAGWSQLYRVTTEDIGRQSSALAYFNNRIWWGLGKSGDYRDVYFKLPSFGEDRALPESGMDFTPGGAIASPWFDARMPLVEKHFGRILIEGENLETNNSIRIYYQTDGANLTDIGVIGDPTSPNNWTPLTIDGNIYQMESGLYADVQIENPTWTQPTRVISVTDQTTIRVDAEIKANDSIQFSTGGTANVVSSTDAGNGQYDLVLAQPPSGTITTNSTIQVTPGRVSKRFRYMLVLRRPDAEDTRTPIVRAVSIYYRISPRRFLRYIFDIPVNERARIPGYGRPELTNEEMLDALWEAARQSGPCRLQLPNKTDWINVVVDESTAREVDVNWRRGELKMAVFRLVLNETI